MIAIDATVERGVFAAHFRCQLGALSVIGGPSGAGKTTFLDLIAGLIPSRGTCSLDGLALHQLPPHRRGIGYAFQDDRLFPHLTVEKNVLFSGRSARRERVVEALQLEPLLQRRPRDLSGGERKRAGIARAVLAAERLLLLDEPLAALDAELKQQVIGLVVELARDVPVIVVSHDPFAVDPTPIGSLTS